MKLRNSDWNFWPSSTSEIGVPVGPRIRSGNNFQVPPPNSESHWVNGMPLELRNSEWSVGSGSICKIGIPLLPPLRWRRRSPSGCAVSEPSLGGQHSANRTRSSLRILGAPWNSLELPTRPRRSTTGLTVPRRSPALIFEAV